MDVAHDDSKLNKVKKASKISNVGGVRKVSVGGVRKVSIIDKSLSKPSVTLEVKTNHIDNTSTIMDNNTSTITDDTNDTSSDDNDVKSPSNVIDNIYKSMSKIIEALTSDNLILNQQVKKIRTELEFVCNTVANLKVENQDLITTYTQEMGSIISQVQKLTERKEDNIVVNELSNIKESIKKLCKELDMLKLKNEMSSDLQKQILDTRSMLMQILNSNMQAIRKEITDVKKIKDDVRQHVKTIVSEEVKEFMTNMPAIDKKFEELAKEQRTILSQHIRKSTVQRVGSLQVETSSLIDMIKQQIQNNNGADAVNVEQLKTQQQEFMTKIEQIVVQMKEKIDKL
jgi:hypothetical protein